MTYVLINKVAGDVVTLAEMKAYLKVQYTLDDALIQALIDTSVEIAEKIMNIDLLTGTWENYRPSFYDDLTLRRGKYQAVDLVEYLLNGSYQTLANTEYQVSIGGIFGVICQINIPMTDNNCNAVRIIFKSGFGDLSSDIPEAIKTAIKQHVQFMYENRGDCSEGCASSAVPSVSRMIYRQYKVIDIIGSAPIGCL